ncbi:ABC transporter permease [Oxalobacter vibrioformis]|uniref:ABC transporter permease n=1 Tax=Oxalobacter vibrioformis TaxID=933080 RepID=A0A9E9LZJ3_9BURK|nr:ABC transporter permease [Oxalobacter vibrioformis]WAW10113.1 ABC transporter permease [Oxalobacter vibrioformis]
MKNGLPGKTIILSTKSRTAVDKSSERIAASKRVLLFLLACLFVAGLAVVSLFVGASDVSPSVFFSSGSSQALEVLMISRIPRTIALLLAGMSMAVAGAIMQMLARNRFVDPSTTGTVESATLGILVIMLFAPEMPVMGKMLSASVFALAGSALFMLVLKRIPLRSPLILPLVGILLGRIVNAITTFIAYRYDFIQSLSAWTTGDFSGVLRGRYELLWLSFALSIIAYIAADRFTVAGLGENFTTNLGLNYRRVLVFGLVIVSMVTASVVVTAGMLPFLGIIVVNVVSLLFGDNLRKTLPCIALFGGGLVLACDLLGRVIRYPYEIPVGALMGVMGGAVFLFIILKKRGGVQ